MNKGYLLFTILTIIISSCFVLTIMIGFGFVNGIEKLGGGSSIELQSFQKLNESKYNEDFDMDYLQLVPQPYYEKFIIVAKKGCYLVNGTNETMDYYVFNCTCLDDNNIPIEGCESYFNIVETLDQKLNK